MNIPNNWAMYHNVLEKLFVAYRHDNKDVTETARSEVALIRKLNKLEGIKDDHQNQEKDSFVRSIHIAGGHSYRVSSG